MPIAIKVSGGLVSTRKRINERVTRKITSYAGNILSNLVRDTPILTGQAKSNWQLQLDTVDSGIVGTGRARPPLSIDYEAYSLSALTQLSQYKPGQTIYIFNNLPYIRKLNNGSSVQAPAGFIENAVAQARSKVR